MMGVTKRISEEDAAEMLGFSPGWLATQRGMGKGPPYYKIGGRIQYDPQDVKDYIDSCRIDPQKKD